MNTRRSSTGRARGAGFLSFCVLLSLAFGGAIPVPAWSASSSLPSTTAGPGSSPNANWRIVGTPDLDGDGTPDILWQNQVTGAVTCWLMNGTTITGTRTIMSRITDLYTRYVSPNYTIVGTPDLDGNGVPDLVAQNQATGALTYLFLYGPQLTGSETIPNALPDQNYQAITMPANTRVVAVADFNNDTQPDLLSQNTRLGQVQLRLMDGDHYTLSPFVAPVALTVANTAWQIVGAADLNADGVPDLVAQNSTTGQVDVWLSNGTGYSDPVVVGSAPGPTWKIVGTPDLNADGKPDLLWQNLQTGDVSYWLMNGTTVAGSGVINAAATLGQWSSRFLWGNSTNASDPFAAAPPIHTSVLPNGKVLAWSVDASHSCADSTDNLYLWDPATGAFSATNNPPAVCLFCCGQSFLPDGRLMVAGGHAGADGKGINNSYFYDWNANSWTPGNPMKNGRWYPTDTTLANGEVFVMDGTYWNASGQTVSNTIPEVMQTDGTWRELTNIPDLNGDFSYYPWLYVAPNGSLFKAGPTGRTFYINTAGAGSRGPIIYTHRMLLSGNDYRSYGTSVMYDTGKILIVGGGTPTATDDAEVIDLTAASPSWRLIDPMTYPRRQLTATLLADGTVLVTGGMTVPQPTAATTRAYEDNAPLCAELWNPQTEKWTTLASMEVPRLYHSTAVLLPDGRVLSGGGGRGGGFYDHNDAEIYSPPYLFKGARPSITAAPATVGYGQAFTVTTPDAANISSINWIRLSSETHGFNENQRINRLSFTRQSGALTVTTPANASLCPPGHYMLFLLNSSGVPSVAAIIQIGSGLTPSHQAIRK